MVGGTTHPKSSSQKPPFSSSSSSAPASSSHRKSRWEPPPSSSTAANTAGNPKSGPKSNDHKPPKPSSNHNPSPKPNSGPSPKPPASDHVPLPQVPPFPFPEPGPPPPPTYGFHLLDRRTIVLADGSVRSFFALPPDYQDFHPPPPPPRPLFPPRFFPMGPPGPDFPGGPRFPPMSPEGLAFRENPNQNPSLKRKFGGGGEDELRHGNNNGHDRGETSSPYKKHMRINSGGSESGGVISKHLEVDQIKLKRAFLHFSKVVNETESERKRYLESGKRGRLQCAACGRSSKDFSDMHALILHTYNSDNADSRVDHLGLHKALCVLMGWNYSKLPDNSKAYQFLPADEAAANQDDLIMWPPLVIIHNTITGKGKDGRMEGLGNKAMDNKIRDLGFAHGKSKSLYGRDGHLGITLIKFNGDQLGLKEALRLSEHFEKENHGRKAWERIQPVTLGKDDEKDPNLVKVDRSGEKKRIFYGYLGTAADLCKVDFETRKKLVIESHRECKSSK